MQNWGILGSFNGKIGELGEIGSSDTHYGIPFAKARRLRYYMQKLVWGHFGAKLGNLGVLGPILGSLGKNWVK